MLQHPAMKFVVAVAAVLAVTIQSYFGGSDDTITFDEWTQVLVAGLGAASLWLAGNVYSHPVYKATKTIVFGLTTAAAALAAHASTGGHVDDVHWWNVAILALGSVFVFLSPRSPDNEIVGPGAVAQGPL